MGMATHSPAKRSRTLAFHDVSFSVELLILDVTVVSISTATDETGSLRQLSMSIDCECEQWRQQIGARIFLSFFHKPYTGFMEIGNRG